MAGDEFDEESAAAIGELSPSGSRGLSARAARGTRLPAPATPVTAATGRFGMADSPRARGYQWTVAQTWHRAIWHAPSLIELNGRPSAARAGIRKESHYAEHRQTDAGR